MITKEKIEKIKKIVEKNYAALAIALTGKDRSLLDLIYFANLKHAPESVPGDLSEVKIPPKSALKKEQLQALDHLNETLKTLIEKTKSAALESITSTIRGYNLETRNKMLQKLQSIDPEESISKLKTNLRALSKDSARDFKRIAVTETANALGMGSLDRIVAANDGVAPEDIYVYRIITPDAATCKWCRKFYLDSDGTPAVYRLSTILANGTNYGLKPSEWSPVAGATHPNERCSPLIQLRPGWKVLAGGKLDFMGSKDWEKYISGKVRE